MPERPEAIVVTARREGFRRGGRAWSLRPTAVPVEDLTPDQLAAIEAEPMLMTSRRPIHAADAPEGSDPAPGSGAGAGESVQVGADPSGAPDAPEGDPARDQAIADAIDLLDPVEDDHFTRAGKPEVAAIRRAGGPSDTTAADRDRVWAGMSTTKGD